MRRQRAFACTSLVGERAADHAAVPAPCARLCMCFLRLQFQEEEREKNEANLMTLVSDSISAMVFFIMFVRDNDARQALFSTIGRLFEGLSDIAKAVLIILVADTLLGYHSEEGEGGGRCWMWMLAR